MRAHLPLTWRGVRGGQDLGELECDQDTTWEEVLAAGDVCSGFGVGDVCSGLVWMCLGPRVASRAAVSGSKVSLKVTCF